MINLRRRSSGGGTAWRFLFSVGFSDAPGFELCDLFVLLAGF
jgi:hypothetical protein